MSRLGLGPTKRFVATAIKAFIIMMLSPIILQGDHQGVLRASPLVSMAAETPHLPKEEATALKKNKPAINDVKHQSASSLNELGRQTLTWIFIVMVLTGGIPILAFFIQYNLVGMHAFCNHFGKCSDYLPRISLIIPAWNEALVLEHTIHLLLKMDYPLSALRIYIIDDGSTDNTQEIMTDLQLKHPNNVFNVLKKEGGKGKAFAINYGLDIILSDEWAQAIMIIDADISFKKDALRKMARHLADSDVGAVTAYIKEGTRNDDYITRSIGYEYITAQSMARRAQNVLGVVACLAGGAQLHSRENILLMGGQINTSTLAEDTYTTFETQRLGKKVIFEGNAFVYAEEPATIVDVWKQRLRWARGNIEITRAFKHVWFHPSKKSRLGSLLFGIIWFCILLMPIVMILASVGLAGLFIINKNLSEYMFTYLATTSFFVYLYATLFALVVDRRTSRIAWFEGLTYPGLISLVLMIISINPTLMFSLFHNTQSTYLSDVILLFIETWSGFCMLWAWLVYRMDRARVSPKITNFLLLIIGYGPLLCAVNLVAYIAEIKHLHLKWDKTEKLGVQRILRPRPEIHTPVDYNKSLHKDIQREYFIFFKELFSLAVVIGFFVIFSSSIFTGASYAFGPVTDCNAARGLQLLNQNNNAALPNIKLILDVCDKTMPDDASVLLLHGLFTRKEASRDKDYASAIAWLEKAQIAAPQGDITPALELAMTYEWAKQPQKAGVIYQVILLTHPWNKSARLGMARVLIMEWHLKEATELYQELLHENPEDIDALNGMGWAKLAEKQRIEATNYFQQVLNSQPQNKDALMGLQDIKTIQQGQSVLLALQPISDLKKQPSMWRAPQAPQPDVKSAKKATKYILSLTGGSYTVNPEQSTGTDVYFFNHLNATDGLTVFATHNSKEIGADFFSTPTLLPSNSVLVGFNHSIPNQYGWSINYDYRQHNHLPLENRILGTAYLYLNSTLECFGGLRGGLPSPWENQLLYTGMTLITPLPTNITFTGFFGYEQFGGHNSAYSLDFSKEFDEHKFYNIGAAYSPTLQNWEIHGRIIWPTFTNQAFVADFSHYYFNNSSFINAGWRIYWG